MIKCDNCSEDAVYQTDDPSARPQRFCKKCLPWHLKKRADLGMLRNPNAEPPQVVTPVVEEAPAPAPKPRKKKAVVEEPVVEEVVVEEAPVEDVVEELPVEEPVVED